MILLIGECEEEEAIWTDFYLKHKFTDEELRLLIDSVLFSRHIPYRQVRILIEKLESLSNVYFKSQSQVFILLLRTAQIISSCSIILVYWMRLFVESESSFEYVEYHTDNFIPEREDGTIRIYIVNPYQMAAQQGKYYLICNYDKDMTILQLSH